MAAAAVALSALLALQTVEAGPLIRGRVLDAQTGERRAALSSETRGRGKHEMPEVPLARSRGFNTLFRPIHARKAKTYQQRAGATTGHSLAAELSFAQLPYSLRVGPASRPGSPGRTNSLGGHPGSS